MHPFLEQLASRLSRHPTPLRHHVVVLPTRRAAFHLKRIFTERLKHQGWLPRITTLNSWSEEVSGLKNADRLQLKFESYTAYQSVLGNAAQNLSGYFGWADTLLDDFNDIESQGIPAATLFRALKEYNEIAQFSFLDDPLSERQERYRQFWNSLKDIHQQFNESLLASGRSYPGLTARVAAERWPQYRVAHSQLHITVAGFNALSASEIALLRKVQEDGCGDVIFDSDAAYLDDLANHAGLFIRRNLRSGLGSVLNNEPSLATKPIDITLSEAGNKAAQADVVAAIIQSIPPNELSRTALVLADESMLLPILNRLPAVVTEANVTMGIGLNSSAFADWIEKLFELHERMIRDEDGTFVVSERLQAIARHPFTKIMNEVSPAPPPVDLRALYTDVKAYHNEVANSGAAWLAPLLYDWQHSAAEAAKALYKFAEAAIPLQGNMTRESLEVRMAGDGLSLLMRLLRKVGRLQQMELLTPGDLLKMIGDALRGARLNLIGEPAVGLQIMGLLETRALGFERVVLCDANEDMLPGKPQYESFIPFEVRAFHKMPGRLEKESVYAYHFYRLLQSANHFNMVYHVDTSGPWGAEKTRYINQLVYHLAERNPNTRIKQVPLSPSSAIPLRNVLTIEKDGPVLEHILNYISSRISASGLNRFFESSLEWYYENVLRLTTPEEEGLLSHASFGTLVHATLEALYKKFPKNHVFDKLDLQAMQKEAEDQLHICFAGSDHIAQYHKGINRLHFESAKHMVQHYLRSEQKAIEAGDKVEFIDTELRLVRKLKLTLNGQVTEATFVGSADLVVIRNGALRVIDFKTGNVKVEDLKVVAFEKEAFTKKPKALQLMLYAWMARPHYPGKKVEAQIISLPKPSDRGLMLPITLYTDEDEAAFEAVLSEVLAEMMDAEIPLSANSSFKYAQFEPAFEGED